MTCWEFESNVCPKCESGPFSPKKLEGKLLRLIRHHCLNCNFEWFEPVKEDEEQ